MPINRFVDPQTCNGNSTVAGPGVDLLYWKSLRSTSNHEADRSVLAQGGKGEGVATKFEINQGQWTTLRLAGHSHGRAVWL